MRRRVFFIAIVAVVAVVCAGCFLLFERKGAPAQAASASVFASLGDISSSTSTSTSISVPVVASAPVEPPANSKEYSNAAYDFSLFYPDDLTATEHPLSGNSMVIIFQDTANAQGFEIFVTPYDQPKITQQRFVMDEPSGVMNDPQNITVDGAAATEFLSTNDAMGASREIWFLHGGFLYEVTAPQALDSWLLQIMGTFSFN